MKENDTRKLLEQYRSGSLSDDEREQLERLSGRDEVLRAAKANARGIVGRRIAGYAGVAMVFVALAGVAIWQSSPRTRSSAPIITEQSVPVIEPELVPDDLVEERPAEVVVASHTVSRKPAKPTDAVEEQRPEVYCNSQCDADSVIGDIWKFLSA